MEEMNILDEKELEAVAGGATAIDHWVRHTFRAGETLESVAAENQTSVNWIKYYNPQVSGNNVSLVGKTVKIPYGRTGWLNSGDSHTAVHSYRK